MTTAGAPLACAVDGPGADARRYALAELLRGLGLAPAWTPAGTAALYAGPHPEHAPPGALRFRTAGAPDRPADPATVGWLDVGGLDARSLDARGPDARGRDAGGRVPLPVGPAGTPAADPARVVDADVLGSAFWWLAGVQEAATVRDAHGRFPFSASMQHALGMGAAAPVDAYRRWLGAALGALGHAVPGRTWGGAPWAVALTHDLDAVHTPRLRALAGGILHRDARRIRDALGPDPRRASVDALAALARRHGVRSTLFVKAVRAGAVGAGSPEDVPYRLHGAVGRRLRALVDGGFEAGLHPGYASHDHAGRIAAERDRLAAAVGAAPRAVRSHFLRWTEPTTPRLYRQAGFEIDSTLGFAESPGFRRGTAHPFRLWDTRAGRAADLWEMPLAAMDAALFTHLELSDDDAAERLGDVLATARRGGGCAVLLWHPAMDGNPAWSRRLDVLDHAVGQARRDGAAVGPLGTLLRAWVA